MGLTDTEEGTPVVDINDDRIGVVTRVEDDTVYIEYAPHIVEQLRAAAE